MHVDLYGAMSSSSETGNLDPVDFIGHSGALSSTLETVVLSISNASSLEAWIYVSFAPFDST